MKFTPFELKDDHFHECSSCSATLSRTYDVIQGVFLDDVNAYEDENGGLHCPTCKKYVDDGDAGYAFVIEMYEELGYNYPVQVVSSFEKAVAFTKKLNEKRDWDDPRVTGYGFTRCEFN